jgi:hypothetical protein
MNIGPTYPEVSLSLPDPKLKPPASVLFNQKPALQTASKSTKAAILKRTLKMYLPQNIQNSR